MQIELLSFSKASQRFDIPQKNLENYALVGHELPYIVEGNRELFSNVVYDLQLK